MAHKNYNMRNLPAFIISIRFPLHPLHPFLSPTPSSHPLLPLIHSFLSPAPSFHPPLPSTHLFLSSTSSSHPLPPFIHFFFHSPFSHPSFPAVLLFFSFFELCRFTIEVSRQRYLANHFFSHPLHFIFFSFF